MTDCDRGGEGQNFQTSHDVLYEWPFKFEQCKNLVSLSLNSVKIWFLLYICTYLSSFLSSF